MPAIWPIPSGDGRAPDRWALVGELRWELGKPGGGHWIEVEDGFITDLASIPGWLHWLINPFAPDTCRAAIIHDALLAQGYEQRVAAGEFYRALVADGVAVSKARMFLVAVLVRSDNWRNESPLSKERA